jgi:hypothetical protein
LQNNKEVIDRESVASGSRIFSQRLFQLELKSNSAFRDGSIMVIFPQVAINGRI